MTTTTRDVVFARKRKRLSGQDQKILKRREKEQQQEKSNNDDNNNVLLEKDDNEEENVNETDEDNNNNEDSENKRMIHKKKKRKKKKKKKMKKQKMKTETEEKETKEESCMSEEETPVLDQKESKQTQSASAGSDEQKEVDWLASYQPIISNLNNNNNNNNNNNKSVELESSSSSKPLGKWFPTARVLKTNNLCNPTKQQQEDTRSASILLFYQYTPDSKPWSNQYITQLSHHISIIAKSRNLGGRLRIANEGINATISSIGLTYSTKTTTNQPHHHPSASTILRHFVQDLRLLDPSCLGICDNFKFMDHLPPDRHFKDFKLLPVKQLVYYGFPPLKTTPTPTTDDDDHHDEKGGIHLHAKDFHSMLQQKDAVVIDVRNQYEAAIGRFDGQQSNKNKNKNNNKDKNTEKEEDNHDENNGAEYIDPKMRKSSDFISWLAKEESQNKLRNKKVLMYCTGGIRCERASAYLKDQMGSQVRGVYQLKGGIEQYFQTFPNNDGGYWQGKNFVFDKREAISLDNLSGDGGVITQSKKKKKKTQTQEDGRYGRCCVCYEPWNRYVGKKKCWTCGVPVLMCPSCLSKKLDQPSSSSSSSLEKQLSVRCPLCVEENITVPASLVEYTENGVKGRISSSLNSISTNIPVVATDDNNNNNEEDNWNHDKAAATAGTTKDRSTLTCKKAASSVLKWGGGHAANKKEIRKWKRRPCHYGIDCKRKDCFFAHPPQWPFFSSKK